MTEAGFWKTDSFFGVAAVGCVLRGRAGGLVSGSEQEIHGYDVVAALRTSIGTNRGA